MTMTSSTTGVSYIDGPEVNTTANDILWSINWMKIQNSAGSNITVLGYDHLLGDWKSLNYSLQGMSGTSDWEEYSFKVLVPENIEKVKLRIYAGSSIDPAKGDSITWIDQLSLYSMMNYTTSPYMQIPIDVPETGRYYILYETLVSPSGGQVGMNITGVNYIIKTQYPQQKWIWVEQALYLNKGIHIGLLSSLEGTNSIRTISLINETNYISASQLVIETLADKNIFVSNSATSFLMDNGTTLIDKSSGNHLYFSNDGSVWTTLSIASEGDYQMTLYGLGDFNLTINGDQVQLVSDGGSTSSLSKTHLLPGSYHVTINGTSGSTLVSLWTYNVREGYSLQSFLDDEGASEVSVEKINPTHYRVDISTDTPFMFCFP